MSVVNFTLPKPLEQRIVEAIKQHGFASKAEFFRIAAMNFLQGFQQRNFYPESEPEIRLVEVTPQIQKKMNRIADIAKKINARHL